MNKPDIEKQGESRSDKNTLAKTKPSAINFFFVLFLAGGVLYAAYTGQMKRVTDESVEAAKSAVSLAISLIGVMAFWLGLMRVVEAGGLMKTLAFKLRPVLSRLFPDVPLEHPAMGAMTLSISANMLGLGNAATPLGIKAITELNKLNQLKGTNSNAMCLFIVITASSVTLLPLGTINVRAAAGSSYPSAIFIPTLIATLCSTFCGVFTALWLAKKDRAYLNELAEHKLHCGNENEECISSKSLTSTDVEQNDSEHLRVNPTPCAKGVGYGLLLLFFIVTIKNLIFAPNKFDFIIHELLSTWLMPSIMLFIIVYGLINGVKIYEAVTEGAKQGFDIATRIIPYLVTILVSISVFRASGAMELLSKILDPITHYIGLPSTVLPMAIVRPLSGSGAFAIMTDLIKQNPDSYDSFVASTMMGCTETSFYILAVYCGAVGVSRVRHALHASLVADIAGIIAASLLCKSMFY